MNTGIVRARDIELEDFLTGLDDGFVVEVLETGHNDLEREITFHTADGEEATLRCPDNMPIAIKRVGEIPEMETE